MILKEVEVNNIRNIDDISLTFTSGHTIIRGDNASGKSSFRLAVEYALYGSLPGHTLENMIRHGQDEMSCKVVFQHRGDKYVIERSSELEKGSISSDASLEYDDETIEGARNVSKKVEELLGLGQDAFNLLNPRQAQISKVLSMTETEKSKMFDSILGIGRFREAYEDMRDVVSPIESRSDNLSGQIETLESWLNEIDKGELKTKLENLKEKRKKKNNEIENKKKDLKKAKEKVEEVEEKKEEIKDKRDAKDKISTLENKIEMWEKRRDKQKEKLENLVEKKDSIEEDIKSIEDKLEELPELEDLENEINNKDEKLSETSEKVMSLRKELKSLEESVDTVKNKDTCPLCRQEVTENYEEDCLSELKRKKENIGKKLKEKQEVMEKEEDDLEKLKDKKGEVREKSNKLENEKSKKNSKLETVKENINDIEDEVEKLEDNINEAEEKIDDLPTPDISDKDEEMIESLYKQVTEERKNIELELNNMENALETVNNKIDNISEKIEEYKKKEKNRKKLKKEVEQVKNLEKDLKVVREMLNKLGPEMREYLRLLLEDEFKKLFNKVRDTLGYDDAEIESDYNVKLKEGGYERLASECSGAEQLAVSILLRLAMIKVLSNAQVGGHIIESLIIDEPEERGVDPENMKTIVEMLEEIELNQLIIITHDPLFQERIGESGYEFSEGHDGTAQVEKIR